MSQIWIGLPGAEELLININRQFVEEDFEPRSVEQRTASGRLVRDQGPVKKQFRLSYTFTTDAALEQLKRLYLLGRTSALSLRVEQRTGAIIAYTVVFRPFSRSRQLLSGTWYWEEVTVELEEV